MGKMNVARPIGVVPPKYVERFFGRVEKTESCWNWLGGTGKGGYGIFRISSTQYYVHRVSWAIANGGTPGSLCIDHLCKNRTCVNPSHMELVTLAVNTMRGDTSSSIPVINSRKTHCIRGHEFNEDNVFFDAKGSRRCRECFRIHDHSPRRLRLRRERRARLNATAKASK